MCAALIRVVLAATFNRQAFSRTKRTKYRMFPARQSCTCQCCKTYSGVNDVCL